MQHKLVYKSYYYVYISFFACFFYMDYESFFVNVLISVLSAVKQHSPSHYSQPFKTIHTTVNGLVAVASCGVITFVPTLYTGSVSDIEIAKKSQLQQQL